MQRGRRISFDYGDVRIGVATSDADSILVSPLTTLKSVNKKLLQEISEILLEIEPITIYIGLPANMSGIQGVSAQKVFEFAERLKEITHIPIEFIDERLSTVSAAKNLRMSGRDGKSSKDAIDMAAAVEILKFALEIEKAKK